MSVTVAINGDVKHFIITKDMSPDVTNNNYLLLRKKRQTTR